MAHGIGAVRAGGLQPFAERFRAEGFAAVVFDYRQRGGSDGEPRDELSVPLHLQDYRTVIDWTAAQPNIDPDRIVAWGTSFAGMHIIELAASDRRLAASIAQVPLADGTAGAAMIPPLQGLRLTTVAVLDRLGSYLYGLELMTPREPANFHNRVADRSPKSISCTGTSAPETPRSQLPRFGGRLKAQVAAGELGRFGGGQVGFALPGGHLGGGPGA
jgi:acetyl esterase/lipase